jgi:hypothetical protein
MKQHEIRTCVVCGAKFSATSESEFCPVCMLHKAAPGLAESGESSFEEAAKATPDQPSKRFDHYELATGEDGKPVQLGRGAMGVTYKAFDINLHCPADEGRRSCFTYEYVKKEQLLRTNHQSENCLPPSRSAEAYAVGVHA